MTKFKVEITSFASKQLRKIPRYILVQFDAWAKIIEETGFMEMQKINAYRDQALKGNLSGKRSSSLSRSYRVIYEMIDDEHVCIIEVQEVNKHEYKK